MDDGPGPQEQQGFEEGVVEHVQERPGHAENEQDAVPVDSPVSATPIPMTMMPMFSMLW